MKIKLGNLALLSVGVLLVSKTYADTTDATAGGGCANDRPCFIEISQNCHTVNFNFSGIENWDFYNVRYASGGGETQVENTSGKFTINSTQPNSTYTINVQGCNSRFLASSECSPWEKGSITTVGDYGPDTCSRHYVWREAFPGDRACVTPEERKAAASDNANALSRREPKGGAFGPDTCRQGYVWREASPEDHVCVLPQTRTDVYYQNKHAASNRLCR